MLKEFEKNSNGLHLACSIAQNRVTTSLMGAICALNQPLEIDFFNSYEQFGSVEGVRRWYGEMAAYQRTAHIWRSFQRLADEGVLLQPGILPSTAGDGYGVLAPAAATKVLSVLYEFARNLLSYEIAFCEFCAKMLPPKLCLRSTWRTLMPMQNAWLWYINANPYAPNPEARSKNIKPRFLMIGRRDFFCFIHVCHFLAFQKRDALGCD